MSTADCVKKRQAIRLAFLVMLSLPFLTAHSISPAVVYSGPAEPQRTSKTRRPVKRSKAQPPRINYSQFSHVTHVTTQKLTCDSCHKFPTPNWKEVRTGEAAFQDVAEFPEHSSCLNCHRPQFFARERPAPVICSNCHVGVTPRDTTRFLFPSLGDVSDPKFKTRDVISEFGVGFPHDKHLDVVGLSRPGFREEPVAQLVTIAWSSSNQKPAEQPKSCPVCHQTYQPQGDSSEEYLTKPPKSLGDNFWLKKGTFKTVPNSHTTCFSCHNAESELPPAPKDCNLCHQLLGPDQKLKVDFDPKLAAEMGVSDKTVFSAWSRRISAGAFRHEGGEHPNLNCSGCHDATVMNTLDKKTLKVPVRSCGGAEGCHITATADDGGALNYEVDQKKVNVGFVCVKCHITFGREPVPANHAEAVPKSVTK
ncbi:MAG: cytochrome c family protein [Pyrinomonadaceae bacterium]|nr:cytochrome c family protein [Pyrinomonadaceae bacterium]